MDNFPLLLVACLASAYLSHAMTITDSSYKLGKIAKPLIKECEAKLVRTQNCVLIAVPKENHE